MNIYPSVTLIYEEYLECLGLRYAKEQFKNHMHEHIFSEMDLNRQNIHKVFKMIKEFNFISNL